MLDKRYAMREEPFSQVYKLNIEHGWRRKIMVVMTVPANILPFHLVFHISYIHRHFGVEIEGKYIHVLEMRSREWMLC
jgi:hypothetical protein